jgi:hypothetical protein
MQPPWEIKVGRKAKILAEFQVPAHKLQKNALDIFLKALVVRYRTSTPEDMLPYYVNKAKGEPSRLSFADVTYCYDLDRRRVGYCCGDWDCYAFAMQEIEAHEAEAIRSELRKNRESRRLPTPPSSIPVRVSSAVPARRRRPRRGDGTA